MNVPTSRRRPLWQPGRLSRVRSFLTAVLGRVPVLWGILKEIISTVLWIVLLLVLFFIYRETTQDALVIDSFTVPRQFEETGLKPEVVADRIGDALREIEATPQSSVEKDRLVGLRDDQGAPDVEIPGTKLSLKVLADISSFFGTHPNRKHVTGDIVVPAVPESDPAKTQAVVTLHIIRGRDKGIPIRRKGPASDIEALANLTAEMILSQVNPYVLAAYQYSQGEIAGAVEILEHM